MRAIIVATGGSSATREVDVFGPACLLPLGDRPFAQHLVERLVNGGIRDIEVIVSQRPELVRAALGTGERWGARIRYHLARRPDRPYDRLRGLARDVGDESALLVHADSLVLEFGPPTSGASQRGVVALCSRRDPEREGLSDLEWTGWSWLEADALTALPAHASRQELEGWLLARARSSGLLAIVPAPLRVEPLLDLLRAQRRLLAGEVTALLSGPAEVSASGVWRGRRVSVHPAARLTPPVFLGELCRIEAGARVGPNVALGARTIVDRRTSISDAVVLPGSFVGSGLALKEVVAAGRHVLDLRSGQLLEIDDPALLSELSGRALTSALRSGLVRLLVMALLLVSTPVLALTAAWLRLTRAARPWRSWEVVEQPTVPDPRQWRTVAVRSFLPNGPGPVAGSPLVADLLLRVLPSLLDVARGRLSLVGLTPRTPAELLVLPREWRDLFVGARTGLVSSSLLQPAESATLEDLLASEALQVVRSSLRRDLRLLLRYGAGVLSGRRLPGGWPRPESAASTEPARTALAAVDGGEPPLGSDRHA